MLSTTALTQLAADPATPGALLSLLPAAFDALAGHIALADAAASAAHQLHGETWREYCEDLAEEEHGAQFDPRSGILVQPVRGVIYRGADPVLEAFYGCFNSQRIESAAALAQADPRVRALCLIFDSPGGYTTGMQSTLTALADLRAARPDLPLAAYAEGLCCSMAYIFAAGCSVIHCSPAAEIGSIGVYAITTDSSQYYKSAGIDRRLVTDGKYKGMGAAGIAWTEDWHAAVRASVDTTSATIRAHVSAARPGITVEDMQGQVWDADSAPAALHDGIQGSDAADYLTLLAANLPRRL